MALDAVHVIEVPIERLQCPLYTCVTKQSSRVSCKHKTTHTLSHVPVRVSHIRIVVSHEPDSKQYGISECHISALTLCVCPVMTCTKIFLRNIVCNGGVTLNKNKTQLQLWQNRLMGSFNGTSEQCRFDSIWTHHTVAAGHVPHTDTEVVTTRREDIWKQRRPSHTEHLLRVARQGPNGYHILLNTPQR